MVLLISNRLRISVPGEQGQGVAALVWGPHWARGVQKLGKADFVNVLSERKLQMGYFVIHQL
jgi:hypothetical protein